MTRVLAIAVIAAAFAAVPAHARPIDPPVRLAPAGCPSGYDDRGYVGPEGTRWRICTIHGYELPPI